MSSTVRTAARVAFLSVVVISLTAVGQSFVAATAEGPPAEENGPPPTDTPRTHPPGSGDGTTVDVQSQFDQASERQVGGEQWSTQRVRNVTADERNLTVVATQGFYVSDEGAELAAFTANGTLVHYEDRFPVYFDVDPVPDERYTVEFVASRHFSDDDCSEFEIDRCTRNVVVRVNLTTGEREQVYAETTPRVYSARWHDVDRLDENTIVIADIVHDSVYAVDTRDGSQLWRWNASENYSEDDGGQPGDWTHLNDVETLEDGRIMVSLRNMDSVVFLEPRGDSYVMNESATLGTDDDHDTLYEQHNPDYIPAERGGPAVVVADSENGRVVEYQREGSDWHRTWSWRDARTQWPRDADRLPNGNTLVTDTHGDRIVELGPDDEVVWTAEVGMAYEAERIGTGDESDGGPAATRRGVDNATASGAGSDAAREGDTAAEQFWIGLKEVTPSIVANGLLYVGPSWIRFTDLAFTALALLTGLCWGSCEFYWSGYTVRGVTRSTASRLGGAIRVVAPWRVGR